MCILPSVGIGYTYKSYNMVIFRCGISLYNFPDNDTKVSTFRKRGVYLIGWITAVIDKILPPAAQNNSPMKAQLLNQWKCCYFSSSAVIFLAVLLFFQQCCYFSSSAVILQECCYFYNSPRTVKKITALALLKK